MIPDAVRSRLQQKLGTRIEDSRSVSGGSINRAAKLRLSDGTDCFLKWNTTANPDMFVKEEKGLNLLASAETDLRIPEVYGTGATAEGTGFFIQEFVPEGKAQPGSAEQFGRALAALHQHRGQPFGLDHDNYIGRLPQSNRQHDHWVDFFIEERLEPQLRMAAGAGKLGSGAVSRFASLYQQLPGLFPEEPPGLLHGDLWGGNYFYDRKGRATLYDPAAYYGHREIEIAFTHLFGGFPNAFYESYEESYPLEPGFPARKDVYNLYPLLVHTNLFGGGYARRVEAIVRRFG